MKWAFIDRGIGGCIIREVSLAETVVAVVMRPTRDKSGQDRAREIAREIVLAHNQTAELDKPAVLKVRDTAHYDSLTSPPWHRVIPKKPPYPFCRHPAKCTNGRCEAEFCCND